MKGKIATTTDTRQTFTITLTGSDIIELLRLAGHKVPERAEVSFHVPGGGDYSNMAVDVEEESPVVIRWEGPPKFHKMLNRSQKEKAMQVNLLSYQPDALELLIYTKNTRLKSQLTLDDIKAWPIYKKMEHLEYMLGTIQSSWEFVDYAFEIKGVTRAFTHQLVRTRSASYAQEAMRVVKADRAFLPPNEALDGNLQMLYNDGMNTAYEYYETMINSGAPTQDARGLLPTNVLTSIMCKMNLRTLSHMAELRLCTRSQGEYQGVFKEMRARVIEVHPWAEQFMQVYCAKHGTCYFPHYKECPIKQFTIAPEQLKEHTDRIKAAWNETNYEAVPVLVNKEGMTK